MSCSVCGVASSGGQYCVACGEPLVPLMAPTATAVGTRERPRPARSTWLAFQEIRLLACPQCGAPNSAARWQCARCGEAFDDSARADVAVADLAPAADEAPPVQPESARWLTLITVVAGVAVVAVAVVLMAARGVGPFGSEDAGAPVTQAAQAGVADVVASGGNGPQGVARNVVDGDAGTAWRVGGDAAGEWVELRLREPVQIDHLLVWNGDQSDEASFEASNRVKDVLITFPDVGKGYTVPLPDRDANVRVDMPDPPVSDKIRLEVMSVYGDAGQTALSEVEALVNSASAAE